MVSDPPTAGLPDEASLSWVLLLSPSAHKWVRCDVVAEAVDVSTTAETARYVEPEQFIGRSSASSQNYDSSSTSSSSSSAPVVDLTSRAPHHEHDSYNKQSSPPRNHMLVELVKFAGCSKFHGNGWYKGPSLRDTEVTSVKEEVTFLCLTPEGAHGLDLSFATHIFLLEPIHDAGLLEQVVSRANRLGATGPVEVETIHVFQVS